MKELKALEILKDLLSDNIGIMFDDMSDEEVKSYVIDSIKEIEELNNRSCDRCKFGKFGVDSIGIEVECSLNWNCSRGHSDKFEAKEE